MSSETQKQLNTEPLGQSLEPTSPNFPEVGSFDRILIGEIGAVALGASVLADGIKDRFSKLATGMRRFKGKTQEHLQARRHHKQEFYGELEEHASQQFKGDSSETQKHKPRNTLERSAEKRVEKSIAKVKVLKDDLGWRKSTFGIEGAPDVRATKKAFRHESRKVKKAFRKGNISGREYSEQLDAVKTPPLRRKKRENSETTDQDIEDSALVKSNFVFHDTEDVERANVVLERNTRVAEGLAKRFSNRHRKEAGAAATPTEEPTAEGKSIRSQTSANSETMIPAQAGSESTTTINAPSGTPVTIYKKGELFTGANAHQRPEKVETRKRGEAIIVDVPRATHKGRTMLTASESLRREEAAIRTRWGRFLDPDTVNEFYQQLTNQVADTLERDKKIAHDNGTHFDEPASKARIFMEKYTQLEPEYLEMDSPGAVEEEVPYKVRKQLANLLDKAQREAEAAKKRKSSPTIQRPDDAYAQLQRTVPNA